MRNLKKEIYHDELCKRMDEWVDGRRNVDLDCGRRPAGSPAPCRDYQSVQKMIVRSNPTGEVRC